MHHAHGSVLAHEENISEVKPMCVTHFLTVLCSSDCAIRD
jgi:hypothetical protein